MSWKRTNKASLTNLNPGCKSLCHLGDLGGISNLKGVEISNVLRTHNIRLGNHNVRIKDLENTLAPPACVSVCDGDANTSLGWGTLTALVNGGNNTAVGYNALSQNTTGESNSAFGRDALYTNSIGNFNTATGYFAASSTSSGLSNTATGYNALYSNQTSSHNTAIGENSLYTTGATPSADPAGSYNTAVGGQALYTNDTGSYNVALGFQALRLSTTGSSNIGVGWQALSSATTGSNNIAVGENSMYQCTIGAGNVAIGNEAADVLVHGSNNVCIGSAADVSGPSVTNEIVIGYTAVGHGDNTITLGNTSMLTIGGQVNFTAYSDERIKQDIETNHLGLDFINKLRPVRYKRVNPADYPEPLLEKRFSGEKPDERPEDNDKKYDGLIAQEVKQVLDELGKEWSGHSADETTGKQGLQYASLVMPLINAVKELKIQNEELKERVLALENKE